MYKRVYITLRAFPVNPFAKPLPPNYIFASVWKIIYWKQGKPVVMYILVTWLGPYVWTVGLHNL